MRCATRHQAFQPASPATSLISVHTAQKLALNTSKVCAYFTQFVVFWVSTTICCGFRYKIQPKTTICCGFTRFAIWVVACYTIVEDESQTAQRTTPAVPLLFTTARRCVPCQVNVAQLKPASGRRFMRRLHHREATVRTANPNRG